MSGEEISGEYETHDQIGLAHWLRNQGYILTYYEEKKKKGAIKIAFLDSLTSVSLSEKMMFSRNLSVMIKSGLSLSRALDALIRQAASKKFKKALIDISASIKKGQSLTVSLGRYPKIFSPIFVAMVRAGEKTGKLSESLDLIGGQLQRDLFLRRTIKNALAYPIIIIVVMILIGVLMLIYVVPTLVQTFEDLEVELPVSTKLIFYISTSVNNLGIFVVLILGGFFSLFFWIFKTKSGKRIFDVLILKIPLIKALVRKVNASRTSRTLSSLISSGVDIIEAFEVTEGVLSNHKFKEVLKKAKAEVQKGSTVASIFEQAQDIYPPLLAEMIAVGEETGTLSDMLLRVAVFFEEEVTSTTKNLTTLIEPLLMVIIGAIVAFFAISIIQPMYSMLGSI